MSFTESILVPKHIFLQTFSSSSSNDDNNNNNTPVKNTHSIADLEIQNGGSRRKKIINEEEEEEEDKNPYHDLKYLKFLNQPKQYEQIPKESIVKNTSSPSSLWKEEYLVTKNYTEDIVKMFPPDYQFQINRVLVELQQHPHVITWDPHTLEIFVYNKLIPKSNLVDILTFLLGFDSKYFEKIDEVPIGTLEFINAYETMIGKLHAVFRKKNIEKAKAKFPFMDGIAPVIKFAPPREKHKAKRTIVQVPKEVQEQMNIRNRLRSANLTPAKFYPPPTSLQFPPTPIPRASDSPPFSKRLKVPQQAPPSPPQPPIDGLLDQAIGGPLPVEEKEEEERKEEEDNDDDDNDEANDTIIEADIPPEEMEKIKQAKVVLAPVTISPKAGKRKRHRSVVDNFKLELEANKQGVKTRSSTRHKKK